MIIIMDVNNESDGAEEREKILGFQPQREIVYNKLLPYSSEIDAESNAALLLIKSHLPKAVLAKELRPSVVHWTNQLSRYIRLYGLKFSKEDHVLFIKLLLELVSIPEVEGSLIEQLLPVLIKLLKKIELLSRDDLVIEWRPLYLLTERLLSSKTEAAGLEWFPSTIEKSLKQVINFCVPYFRPSATQEMLDEWRPLLCPFDVTAAEGLKYMELFLPTIALTEDERNCSWRLWFGELFNFWESIHNCPSYEAMFTTLFARLALHNIGHIDWASHCSKILTRLLRTFKLPVGKLNHTAKVSAPLQHDSTARWIIAMMGGPCSDAVLSHIESMFKAIESYYYPSNFGKWTPNLLSFLQSVTYKFVYRIHRERYKKDTWQGKTPESYLITDEQISTFVRIVKPVSFLALYSKFGSSQACRVLQLLATLRPELVLPELLEKSYVALETLTEPHQLKGCLSALTFTLRSLMKYSKWYKEGRSHIIPILYRSLPAIDPNDFPKSMVGFHFISTCFSLMPIIDCSNAVQNHPELDEDSRNLCLATAELPDFVVQYLDRIFSVIESLNQEHSTQSVESGNDTQMKSDVQEAVIISGITSTLAVILIQSSDYIFKRCLEKIFLFTTSRLLNGSAAHSSVMQMCLVVSKANPELAAKKFVPHFCRMIKDMFEENPHLHKEEKTDKQLQWNLVVLTGILKFGAQYAIEYKEELFEVLQLSLKSEAKSISQQACDLLQTFMLGLTSFYASETDVNQRTTNDDEYLPINDWGKCVSPWQVNLSWHEPTEQEIKTGFEIIDKFLFPELEELTRFIDGEKVFSKDELLRCLTIIHSITVGSGHLMVDAEDKEVEIRSRKTVTELKTWSVETISFLDQYNKVLEERGGQQANDLKKTVFQTTRKTLWHIMKTREDDVKSISKIIAIYSECLKFHEPFRSEFDKHWSIFTKAKKSMQDTLRGRKRHQRLLITNRALLQHQLRSLACDRTRYTEITHYAMVDLLKLSMSHYSQVRIAAQRIFFRGLTLSPYKAEEHYLPLVLESLRKDPVENHKEIKGALYLLHGPNGKKPSFLAYMHQWDVIAKSWPAIIDAIKSDKPSVVKLYAKLLLKIQIAYNTIAIDVKVNDKSLNAARGILRSSSQPSIAGEFAITGVEERLKERNCENLALYHKLLRDLIDQIDTGTLSWRQTQYSSTFLQFLIRFDVPLNSRLSGYIVSGLTDDVLSFRQMFTSAMNAILKKQERKRKVIKKTPDEISGIPVEAGSVLPGDRHDNKWMQYDSSNLLTTAEEYDSTIFVEKTHWGYYQWPKTLKTYALKDDALKFDRTRDEMSDDEKEVFDRFSSPDFVRQLIKYHSLENIKGKDRYDLKRVDMFKGLFRNFGDSFLPIFRAELEELAKDPHETSQRCVSEIVAGLVIGSKHWNFDKVNSMWSWLLPVLQKTVENISVETLKDWEQAYGHIVQNRDPRKLHWVIEFLIKDPVSGKGGSFMDASRLLILQGGIHQQEWRVSEVLHRLLEHIEPKLDHQYKNVRDKMASSLASIFFYDIALLGKHDMLCPTRDLFIERILPRLAPLSKEGTPSIAAKTSEAEMEGPGLNAADFNLYGPSTDVVMSEAVASASAASVSDLEASEGLMDTDVLENIISQLQQGVGKMFSSEAFVSQDKEVMLKQFLRHHRSHLPPGVSEETIQELAFGRCSQIPKDVRVDVESSSVNSSLAVDEERNSAIRLLKTLMKWIVCSQRGCLQPTISSVLKLLPYICKLSPVDTKGADEELHHDTQASLSCLAQSYFPPHQLRHVVDTIKQISALPSWHARHTVLKFSQIFIFNNLLTLQEQRDCVDQMRDIVLCLVADEQLEVREMATKTLGGLLQCNFLSIDEKLKRFIEDNCKIRVKRRKKQENTPMPDYQTNVRNRHAGVLSLSSCILSSPYSIPEHLPDLLMKLSNHLHDPQPIQSTVKKTFSEFRRTHHDTWHLDKMKFSSDQLSILTDLLVSPCYYA